MRVLLALLVTLVASCSFVGGGVPAHPESTFRCPTGVVIADGLGTAFFLIPPTLSGMDGAINGWRGEYDGVAFVIIGIPMAIIGTVYLASTIHGVRANRRCERLKATEADAQTADEHRGAKEPERAPVIGDTQMVCAISEPDVGECFGDETACASQVERGGGTCEPRPTVWCFDISALVGAGKETTCAASRIDCDARRIAYSRDATLVVTTCGTYSGPVTPPETTTPPETMTPAPPPATP